MTMSQRLMFAQTMLELATEDPNFLLLDGDLASSTRADLVAEQRPTQFLQMGIAEQNLIGVAAGLATVGYHPWISSFAVFLVHRDLDQVRMLLAQNRLPVRLAAAYSGLLTGATGRTHQCVEDLAIMRALPHMTVLCPADAHEARLAMRHAHQVPGPCYIRLCRDPGPDIWPQHDYAPERGLWLRLGQDGTLISTGVQSTRVLAAAELLDAEGKQFGVLHLPAVKPLAVDDILRAARLGPIVTVEEHSVLGGLGGAVAEVVCAGHPRWVRRLGLMDCFGTSGDNQSLLEHYGLAPQRIAQSVARMTFD